jgi:hypothetical protein
VHRLPIILKKNVYIRKILLTKSTFFGMRIFSIFLLRVNTWDESSRAVGATGLEGGGSMNGGR